MLIQSHRGAGNMGPENTLESFELAWKIGTVPEADVRETKDGVLVAFHDNNFERLVKDASDELKKLSIEDLTWEKVSHLDVGAYKGEEFKGQHIPRISDVFETMRSNPSRLLYLDVKVSLVGPLAELARKYGVGKQCILASTDYSLVKKWKELLPDSQTLLWMGGSEERLRERMEEFRKADFACITQLQIHVYPNDPSESDPFKPSSQFLREVALQLKERGILFQALPWGGDTPETYHELIRLGVQSFATDNPEMVIKAVD